MSRRLCSLLILSAFVLSLAFAKDKNKGVLPAYVMQARTAVVVIDPDAGEPLDHPYSNSTARASVEKALLEWGRFDLLNEGQESDLIFVVRTGNGKTMQPTVKGGPIDQRPGYGQSTDSTIRVGGHQVDPNATPQNRGPHMSDEVGPGEDMLEVYRGGGQSALDSTPVWHYIAKDCLQPPKNEAVEQFRKLIAEQEKPKQPNKP